MYIRYDDIGDRVLVHIPDSATWEIRYKLFDDEGYEDHGLYLTINDKEAITLKDTDYWCQGRQKLPYTAVGMLYEEMVTLITQKIIDNPDLRFLDIEEIETELMNTKYEKLWKEKGYLNK